jgi:cobalt-zinc-cadmium efflux system outer membrane protein
VRKQGIILLIFGLVAAVGCASSQLGEHRQDRSALGKTVPSAVQWLTSTTDPKNRSITPPELSSGGSSVIQQTAYTQSDENGNAAAKNADTSVTVDQTNRVNNSLIAPPFDAQSSSLDVAATTGSFLTLSQAEEMALRTSPSIAQLTARIESLQGKFVQSGLRPNPEFGYFGDFGHDRSFGEHGVYWNREFVRGGKLELSQAVVCREIQVAEQELEMERLRVLTDTRAQFYELLVLQRRLEIAQQFVLLSEQAVAISQQLFDAEEIAELALLQAKLQARNTNVVVLQAETQLQGAANRLAALVGLSESEMIRAEGVVEPAGEALQFESLLGQLLLASPEIARAQAVYARSQRNLDRQLAEQIPNIQLQTNVRHSYGNDDELVQFQIGRPIQVNNWNQGNIRSARADIVSTAESVQRVERDLKQRFAATFQEYNNARVRIEQFQDEIIPNARRVYELTATGYRQGEIGYLDLITAQRLFFDAELSYTVALLDYWSAFSLLDGYLLSGSLKID